jgi:hypothetical protein
MSMKILPLRGGGGGGGQHPKSGMEIILTFKHMFPSILKE